MSEILFNRTKRDGSGYVVRRENDGRVIATLIDPAPRTYQTGPKTRAGIAVLHSAITVDLTGTPEQFMLSEFFDRVASVRFP